MPASTRWLTGPPLKPNQRIAARKTPRPARPRPTSSGWWWARPFVFFPRRFLTRDGVFGDVLWGRFLRAMRGTSRSRGSVLPRGERGAEHPEVRRGLVREELHVEIAADRPVQHQ